MDWPEDRNAMNMDGGICRKATLELHRKILRISNHRIENTHSHTDTHTYTHTHARAHTHLHTHLQLALARGTSVPQSKRSWPARGRLKKEKREA